MTASGEEGGDHGVHVHDWPRGYGRASWWPLVTAVGVIGFMVGVGVYVVGSRVRAIVDPNLGVAISLVGVLVAATGVAGWVYHGFIARYRERSTESHWSRDKYLWGMLLYLPVELALFGAGILYFTFVYFGSWPPGSLPQMLTTPVVVMTALLLVSSLTNYFAGRALKNSNRRRFLVLLAATPVLGVVFLALKASNWHRLVVQEGYTLGDGIYWTAFFSMSGLHGLLVTAGVAFMLVVLARALAGHYSADRHVSVTTANMYWWIVDSVWLILIVELYGTAALCRATGPC